MKKLLLVLAVVAAVGVGIYVYLDARQPEMIASLESCKKLALDGPRKIAADRADRFLGKVQVDTARCRGGERAARSVEQKLPWLDWSHYWGAGDANSRVTRYDEGALRKVAGALFEKLHIDPNLRGIDGALIDLEYERVELIKFNLFDNYTYRTSIIRNSIPSAAAARSSVAGRLSVSAPSPASATTSTTR